MEKNTFDLSSPTKITQENIYNIYCDNYDSIHYLFVEFQFSWLQQAYRALNDIDTVSYTHLTLPTICSV